MARRNPPKLPGLTGGANRLLQQAQILGPKRQKQNIAMCTPSLGMVSIFWSRCHESILWPNFSGKTIFYLKDGVGGEIAECRNAIVDAVLAYHNDLEKGERISHMFWVDDDVLVQPGCLLELLHQSQKFNVPIVNGVYFQKLPGNLTSPLIYPGPGMGAAPFVPDTIMEAWGAGMGLTLVKREVYEEMRDGPLTREVDGQKQRMVDKYGRPRWYYTSDAMVDTKQESNGVIGTGWTEDTWFYGMAEQLGLKVLVDSTKHAFGFHLNPLTDEGYPETQYRQWVAGECIRWETAEGEVVWD